MNWAKLSSIAELLSSVAVLVTLVFLTIETRQNTIAVQAGSLDGSLQADLQHLYSIVGDPDLWFSYYKEDLSETERVRLFHFLAAMVRMRERDWLQYQAGALDEADWLSYQSGLIGTLLAPQPRRWWTRVTGREAPMFDSGFIDYINSVLADRPTATPQNTLGAFD